MRFIKCTISKPSLFDNRLLEFGDDITFVKGKNGSGKSFAAKALTEALWLYFPWTGKKLWNTIDDTYLDLCFNLNKGEKTGMYRFRYQASTLSIFDISDGEKELIRLTPTGLMPARDVLEKLNDPLLAEFISDNDLKTFINIAYIPSPADIDRDEVIDYDIIKNVIINDDSGFYERYSVMNERYLGNEPASPLFIKIEEAKRTLNELNKEVEIIRIKNQYFEKLEREKNSIEYDITELKANINRLERKKDMLGQVSDNLKKIEIIGGKINKIEEEITDEQAKAEKIKNLENISNFQRFKFPESLDMKKLDKIQSLFREIIDNNEKINSHFSKKRLVNKRLTTLSEIAGTSILLSTAGVLIKNSFVLEKSSNAFLVLLIFAMFAALSGLLYYMSSVNKKELFLLQENRLILNGRLEELIKENSFPFADYNLDELYDILLKYFEDYTEYSDNLSEINAIQSTLAGEERLREIRHEMKLLKNRTTALQEETYKNLNSVNLDPKEALRQEDIEQLISYIDDEINNLGSAIASKEELLVRIEREKLLSVGNDYESVVIKRDEAQKLFDKLQAKKETAFFVTGLMNDAVRKREQQQIKKFVADILSRFNTITDNQFRTLVDEQIVENFIAGNGRHVSLNPSVVHTLLLSAKFSLNGFLSGTKKSIPLILDDPFLFMDDDRISRLLEQVREIAAARQVTLFTHRVTESCREKMIEL
ncbi:MAG: hypothetical protein LBT84_04140 [Spirochaetia bacterium]|nr:hypothetical protein [Spirochaetia bacterium]